MEFQPPALYPQLSAKALSLDNKEKYADLVSTKNRLRNSMRNSLHFVNNSSIEKLDFNSTVERYSDRYLQKKADINKWNANWNMLPKELKHFYEKSEKVAKSSKRKSSVKPNLVDKKTRKNVDIEKLVDDLIEKEEENDDEENEENGEKGKKKEKNSDDEEENPDFENADEEEGEEDNDYIDSYFDNGEDYNDDDGGGDDEGPVY